MTSAPTPLRSPSQGEGPESPEALMISALLEEGEFDASRFRVTEDDLSCLKQLWTYCVDHQYKVGRAPGLELVRRHFPEFQVTPDVDPYWAAERLRRAAAERRMRVAMEEAVGLLANDDVDSAYALMGDLQAPAAVRRAPVTLFDTHTYDDEAEGVHLPVPYKTLGKSVGGIGPGQMWTFGMRTGYGKTQVICNAWLPEAVKSGFTCSYFSCEMPAYEIAQLVRRGMAAWDQELVHDLDSEDREKRKEALRTLEARTANTGSLSVFDPSHGRITVEALVEAIATQDLVVIDHIGLVQTKTGKRVSDDWRVLTEISNRLKEGVLTHKGRLIVLTQINRQGASASPERCPRLEEIAGADAIGQDSDVVITGQRFSTSVHKLEAVKVRRGTQPYWYTHFSPGRPSFGEITKQKAEAIANQDEDALSRMR